MKRKLLTLLIIGGVLLLGHSTAQAIPLLQLYIEGGWYDETSESWVAIPGGSSGGGSFRLWAIGNLNGPGGKGTISDVRLGFAYDAAWFGKVTITFAPTWIGGDGSYTWDENGNERGFYQDTTRSLPGVPLQILPEHIGDIPLLTDGTELPKHDAYGPDVAWQQFDVGDFDDLGESPDVNDSIADFITPPDWPGGDFYIEDIDTICPSGGQINAYDVVVTFGAIEESESGEQPPKIVHIDMWDSYQANNGAKATFAPFSHDAHVVPEPFSGIVWLLIGVTWAGSAWMYRYYSQWRKLEQEAVLATATSEGTIALRDEQVRRARSAIHAETAVEQHQLKG